MQPQIADGTKKKFDITGILDYAIYFVCIAFIVVVAFGNRNFLTIGNFLLILQQTSPYFIAASGMAFVLMSGGVDISVGQNMLLSAAVGGWVAQFLMDAGILRADTASLLIISIIASLATGAVVGFINGVCIAKFNILPFIATLAMTNMARGVGLVIIGGESRNLEGITRTLNINIGGFFPLILIPAIVVLVVFNFIARSLPFGRKVKAIGRSAENANKVGIQVVKTKIIVHTMCGALAGVCGLLSAAQMRYLYSSHGTGSEFIIISGCILGGVSLFGGKGSVIPGAIIGVMMVQMIVNGLTMINANPYVYIIVRGVVIFMAVMIESVKHKGTLK